MEERRAFNDNYMSARDTMIAENPDAAVWCARAIPLVNRRGETYVYGAYASIEHLQDAIQGIPDDERTLYEIIPDDRPIRFYADFEWYNTEPLSGPGGLEMILTTLRDAFEFVDIPWTDRYCVSTGTRAVDKPPYTVKHSFHFNSLDIYMLKSTMKCFVDNYLIPLFIERGMVWSRYKSYCADDSEGEAEIADTVCWLDSIYDKLRLFRMIGNRKIGCTPLVPFRPRMLLAEALGRVADFLVGVRNDGDGLPVVDLEHLTRAGIACIAHNIATRVPRRTSERTTAELTDEAVEYVAGLLRDIGDTTSTVESISGRPDTSAKTIYYIRNGQTKCAYGQTHKGSNNHIVVVTCKGYCYYRCYGSTCRSKRKILIGRIPDYGRGEKRSRDSSTSGEIELAPETLEAPQEDDAFAIMRPFLTPSDAVDRLLPYCRSVSVDSENTMVPDISFGRDRIVVIRAGMGCGKTWAMQRFLQTYPNNVRYKRVLLVSTRIAYAINMHGRFSECHFELYLKIQEEGRSLLSVDRLIIGYESLHRLVGLDKPYDLVCIDESESIFCQALAIQTNGMQLGTNASMLQALITSPRTRTLAMDADISERTVDILRTIVGGDASISTYIYTHNRVHRNVHVLTDTDWHRRLMGECRARAAIHSHGDPTTDSKHRIVVISGSRRQNTQVRHDIEQAYPSLKIITHDRHQGVALRRALDDVNELWKDVDVLFMTATITVGVSYDEVDLPFDSLFMWCVKSTVTPRVMMQMSERCRTLRSENIFLYMDEKTSDSEPSLDDCREAIDLVETTVPILVESIGGTLVGQSVVPWLRVAAGYAEFEQRRSKSCYSADLLGIMRTRDFTIIEAEVFEAPKMTDGMGKLIEWAKRLQVDVAGSSYADATARIQRGQDDGIDHYIRDLAIVNAVIPDLPRYQANLVAEHMDLLFNLKFIKAHTPVTGINHELRSPDIPYTSLGTRGRRYAVLDGVARRLGLQHILDTTTTVPGGVAELNEAIASVNAELTLLDKGTRGTAKEVAIEQTDSEGKRFKKLLARLNSYWAPFTKHKFYAKYREPRGRVTVTGLELQPLTLKYASDKRLPDMAATLHTLLDGHPEPAAIMAEMKGAEMDTQTLFNSIQCVALIGGSE